MYLTNQGFSINKVREFKEAMAKTNQPYIIVDSEDNSDEYLNFYFIGFYEQSEFVR